MPIYEATISGKTYEFDAADPQEAAGKIDTFKGELARQDIAGFTGEVFSGDPARAERATARALGSQAGPGTTAGLGLQYGTLRNFPDEIAGLSEASGLPVGTPPIIAAPIGAARMGLEQLGLDRGPSQAYDVGRERLRGFYEGAREANPGTALGSEIVGGFAGPVPGGAGSVAQQALRGGGYGLAEGLLSGFGAGEGAGGSAAGAGLGGTIGAAVGSAFPVGANVLGKLYRAVIPQSDEAVRAAAERQTREAMQRDASRVTPERQADLVAAERAGQPIVLGDLGDKATETLARWSANQSPEARAALTETTGERFASQGQRAATWWDQITDAPRALQTRERLQEAAERANRPAYQRAYAAGEGGIWDDILQGLTTSPVVRKAIRDAEVTGADRAAAQGHRAPSNPFVEEPDGTLTLRRNPDGSIATPTLVFWDDVQRNLRSIADVAKRSGDDETASRVGNLRRSLNAHLDAAVPAFGQARRGAAQWFGYDDALEAGQNFLRLSPRGGASAEKAALARMNEAERGLFRQGVVEDVRNQFRALGDNRDINQLFNNPELRERLTVALGPQQFQQLQQYMRVEQVMTDLRRAVSGGSNTTAQLMAAGAIGGAGGFLFGDDPFERTTYGGAGAMAAALLKRGNTQVNARVAEQVGRLLSSADPEDWRRVATMVERVPVLRRAWNELSANAKRAAQQQAGAYAGQEMSP